MRRKQNSASIVTVASDGARIALGGVAREPVRAPRGRGHARRRATSTRAAEAAPSRPPTRSTTPYASAWYRRRVLPVHVRRALIANAV